MDTSNIKSDPGLLSVEYYLNRLIQRAIIEPKPLLKIYEEECQRHPDISVTVSFKEFQSALQKHCMTLQSRHHTAATLQMKHQEQTTKYMPAGDSLHHRKRRRNSDMQAPVYQRIPQPVLDRYSPQGSQSSNRYSRNNGQQPSATAVNLKSEDPSYSTHPLNYPTSRPASVQPPVEEEPPPEFIEMSSHTPRLSESAEFSNTNVYQSTEFGEQSSGSSVICKAEANKPDNSAVVEGTVQSSSPSDRNTSLCAETISPLNVRCVKCIKALVTCAVMPCGHCCLCTICGQTVLSLKQVCPVCRKTVATVVGYSGLMCNSYNR